MRSLAIGPMATSAPCKHSCRRSIELDVAGAFHLSAMVSDYKSPCYVWRKLANIESI